MGSYTCRGRSALGNAAQLIHLQAEGEKHLGTQLIYLLAKGGMHLWHKSCALGEQLRLLSCSWGENLHLGKYYELQLGGKCNPFPLAVADARPTQESTLCSASSSVLATLSTQYSVLATLASLQLLDNFHFVLEPRGCTWQHTGTCNLVLCICTSLNQAGRVTLYLQFVLATPGCT